MVFTMIRPFVRVFRGAVGTYRRTARSGAHKLHVSFLAWYDRVADAPGKRIYDWLQRRGIELVDAHTSHLGHAGVHTDYLVKKAIIDQDKTRIVLHVYRPARNTDQWQYFRNPNAYLQTLWQNYCGVMMGSFSHHLLHPIMWTGKGEPRGRGYKLGNDYPIISRKVGCQLRLPAADVEKGKKILSELGVNPDSWFFCFYARDAYYKQSSGHDYRNCDIRTLIPAIEYLVSAGGQGIRLGSSRSDKLPTMDHVVDYPRSDHRSGFMDVFLAANCRFFIGSPGGIGDLARCVLHATTIFQNLTPLARREWKWLTDDTVFIPKLLWSSDLDRYMSFAEIYESGAAEYLSTAEYERNGIEVHDNTADDILTLTEEVFLRKAGLWSQSADGELRQTEFKKLLARYCSHELASFRIGDAFLRRYEFLLEATSVGVSAMRRV